jgi:excisionase family DNA binding protein
MSDVERAQKLIDLEEVARRLGVNQRHVRRLGAERRIPFVKWGHLLRCDPATIDAWVDEHRHGAEPVRSAREYPRVRFADRS